MIFDGQGQDEPPAQAPYFHEPSAFGNRRPYELSAPPTAIQGGSASIPAPELDDSDTYTGSPHDQGPPIEADPPSHPPSPEGVDAALHAMLMQTAGLNFGEMVGVKYVFEQTLDYDAPIAPEYLDVVRAVYAEPDNDALADLGQGATSRVSFSDVCEQLAQPGGIVVLPRAAGTGRTITAHALLARLVDTKKISEVWPISFGGAKHFPAKRLPRADRRGYLLELPPDEDDFEVADSFGASLGSVAYKLKNSDSCLVVLTTPEQWQRVSHGAPPGIAPALGTARQPAIAERWLRAQEPELPIHEWLKHPLITPLLDSSTPLEVLRIVELILEEHRTAERARSENPAMRALQQLADPPSFEAQVSNVAQAFGNWEDELHKWHEQPGRTPFHRNFLLAAAALRGDTAGHIYAKAAELTTHLDGIDVPIMGQQSPGLIAMTRAIEARRQSDETLAFTRPHWDDAALEYFWTDRPLSRLPFLEWLAKAPLEERKDTLESIDKGDRRALAERVGEFALRWAVRHQRREPLQEIVKAWHGTGTTKEAWRLAVDLLDNAAIRAASAPFVHAMLLAWARSRQPALQAAVVEVCTGEFGRKHTDKALRRIRHIASAEDPAIIDKLRDTVHTLWANESTRTMLFNYIAQWCKAEGTADTVGRRTFAALAAYTADDTGRIPLLLAAIDVEDGEGFRPSLPDLVAGWRTLLKKGEDSASAAETRDAVFLWLGAAQTSNLRDLVLGVLRQAAGVGVPDRCRLRDALREYAFEWVAEDDRVHKAVRDPIQKALSDLLDEDLKGSSRRSTA